MVTLYIWTEADEFSTNILAKMMAMMDQVTLIETASVNIGCLLGSIWPVSNPLDNFLFMREKNKLTIKLLTVYIIVSVRAKCA